MLSVNDLDSLDTAFYECINKLEKEIPLEKRETLMTRFDDIYFELIRFVKEEV